MINDDEGDNDDAMEVHLGLRLRDKAVLYASFHNISRRQQAGEIHTPALVK